MIQKRNYPKSIVVQVLFHETALFSYRCMYVYFYGGLGQKVEEIPLYIMRLICSILKWLSSKQDRQTLSSLALQSRFRTKI